MIRPPRSTLEVIREKALTIALTQVGVMESPLGSDRGPEVDEYNRTAATFVNDIPGAPWCMSFIYWCFYKASELEPCPMPRTAYCPYLFDWAKANGRLVALPERADIFLVSQTVSEGQRFVHAGLITEVKDGTIHTVEGNTNLAGESRGIGVFLRNRNPESLTFIRI